MRKTIREPRIRKTAASSNLSSLRLARKQAEQAGNQAEASRIECELGRLTGMNG